VWRRSCLFAHFQWPFGDDDQWASLPAWGFLLEFYGNYMDSGGTNEHVMGDRILRGKGNFGEASRPGLYLSNFIRGVEVLAIEVDDRANA